MHAFNPNYLCETSNLIQNNRHYMRAKTIKRGFPSSSMLVYPFRIFIPIEARKNPPTSSVNNEKNHIRLWLKVSSSAIPSFLRAIPETVSSSPAKYA